MNVETQRKAAQKEAAKKDIIAGQGDARLRYTHPFPNAPVTVRASDQADPDVGLSAWQVRNHDQLLVHAGRYQSAELGRNGQVDCVRSGAGPGMADRSAKGVSSPGRGDRTGRKLAFAPSAKGRFRQLLQNRCLATGAKPAILRLRIAAGRLGRMTNRGGAGVD